MLALLLLPVALPLDLLLLLVLLLVAATAAVLAVWPTLASIIRVLTTSVQSKECKHQRIAVAKVPGSKDLDRGKDTAIRTSR